MMKKDDLQKDEEKNQMDLIKEIEELKKKNLELSEFITELGKNNNYLKESYRNLSNELKHLTTEHRLNLEQQAKNLLLIIIDNLEIINSSLDSMPEQVRVGLEMISKNMLEKIKKFGISLYIPEINSIYDSSKQEAVSNSQGNIIKKVLSPGYILQSTVLKLAKVITELE